MIFECLFLVAGLTLILMGANWLVDGSSSIARKSGISEFVIGLTIVGIGTSTPEMVVSYLAAFQGKADMAVGNIIGSNIFNTLMILGVTTLIYPLAISKNTIKRDIPLNIAVTVLLIALGMKHSLFGIGSNTLSRFDGVLMLCIFALYLWKSFRSGQQEAEDDEIKLFSTTKSVILVCVGLGSLILGGRLFVNSATEIARYLNLSEKFIAITVMSAGTSLPELATCVVAALKKRSQLALGNILGSNISNILLILGGAAIIHPLSFESMTIVDLGTVLFAAVFILISAYTIKVKKLDRVEGAMLLAMEAAYLVYLFTSLP